MKVPEPVKKPSGMYFIQLRLGGKSYPFTYPTAKLCREAARSFKADYLAGKKVELIEKIEAEETIPKAPTLGSVIDSYLSNHRAVLSPSTMRGYACIRRNRFKAYMNVSIDELPPWQTMINDEVGKVAAKTLKNSWALVARALRAEQKITPDAMLPQVPIIHKPYLSPQEILPFCEAIKGDIAEIPALLELHGLRRSEAKGLEWKDVDLQRQLVRVQGAMVMGEDGLVSKDTNKNATSTRVVHIIIPQLLDALSSTKEKSGFVVKVSFQTMLRHVKRACEQAGVTVVGNHGLRYSCASLAYHLKIPERALMEMCGWADYATMHKIYVRIASEDVDSSFEVMKDFFSQQFDHTNG